MNAPTPAVRVQPRRVYPHGDRNRYLHGPDEQDQPGPCRCAACRAANTRYTNRRRMAIDAGRHQFVIDAEPVRQHVRALQEAGLGYQRIADIAGVTHETVSHLLYGKPSAGKKPTRRISAANARALLAVQASQLPADGWVPGVGIQRRLQALAAIGWSSSRLARRLGTAKATLLMLMNDGPGRKVTVPTARRVRDLYEQLWNVDPVTSGATPATVQLVRERAAAKGWAPPMAWDDESIDDQAARPDLGEQRPRDVALAENCEELLAQGFTVAQAAERLGVSKSALEHARRRAREAAA